MSLCSIPGVVEWRAHLARWQKNTNYRNKLPAIFFVKSITGSPMLWWRQEPVAAIKLSISPTVGQNTWPNCWPTRSRELFRWGGLCRFARFWRRISGSRCGTARNIFVRRGENVVLAIRLGMAGELLTQRGDLFCRDFAGLVSPFASLVGHNVRNFLIGQRFVPRLHYRAAKHLAFYFHRSLQTFEYNHRHATRSPVGELGTGKRRILTGNTLAIRLMASLTVRRENLLTPIARR